MDEDKKCCCDEHYDIVMDGVVCPNCLMKESLYATPNRRCRECPEHGMYAPNEKLHRYEQLIKRHEEWLEKEMVDYIEAVPTKPTKTGMDLAEGISRGMQLSISNFKELKKDVGLE